MRTAVIRINVDRRGALSGAEVETGVAEVLAGVDELGMRLVDANLRSLPPNRRELQFLAAGEEPAALQRSARDLCRRAFGTDPAEGTTTYLRRGTGADALGGLFAFG